MGLLVGMRFALFFGLLVAMVATVLAGCSAPGAVVASAGGGSDELPRQLGQGERSASKKMDTLVVGGGCFWCVEAQFEMLKGVEKVESAYAGGTVPNPTYQMVVSGLTGAAEVIRVTFDASVISKADLLRIFFVAHDPTTLNRQGPDVGTQYRSVIFYATPEEKALAEQIKKEISDEKIFEDPIVTTIEPLTNFTIAEDYHQDYFKKFEQASPEERAKMNAGYCSAVVSPKVSKFRQQFAHLLKK